MTNLTIYRGETLIAQVTLTGKTMKLGRSKENDIVLEDPGKGVSRVHAELRPEGDRYRLVDLDSQNGIWVSGKRVTSVLLAPGVVAAMGPFRVAVDATSPMTQIYTPIKDEVITQTEYNLPVPPVVATPPSEPVAVDGAGALLDDLGPGGGTRPPRPSSEATSPPTAPPKKAPYVPPPVARGTARSGSDGSSKTLLVVLGALVLMAASGFGAYKLLQRRATPPPVWDATVATALVNSGRCQEALDQQINRALAADPNNALALDLKQKCSSPPPPPPTTTTIPAVITKTNAEKLDEAEASLQAKACQPALDIANEVLTADANDARAKDLAKKASDCLKPITTGTTASNSDPLVKIPPAQGGLDPQQGETNKEYKARVAAMRKRYDDAVGLLQAQRFLQASREFEAIASGVPQGYLDLAQRRADLRNAMREESKALYNGGAQAEQRGEWNAAIAAYNRAHDLDPSRDVTAEIARISDAKAKIGRQLCSEADVAFALSHNTDAAEKYAKALELLPSGDECSARAKERLNRIRK